MFLVEGSLGLSLLPAEVSAKVSMQLARRVDNSSTRFGCSRVLYCPVGDDWRYEAARELDLRSPGCEY
ncbi:hypothetical protein [Phaeobacter sp. C3_T13_0]|uniref:hypothetical protein n=1 Tax=Phaeobacter cretensis TaxID=3342641 RepID=UPI0039BD30E2